MNQTSNTCEILLSKERANGWRYLLVGGTRQRYFIGANSKLRKELENAQNPTSQVHAVLVGVLRRTPLGLFIYTNYQ